jgi:hypothetical protein
LTLEPVEFARQGEGVLVGVPDVGSDPALPHVDGVVVASVDGADEAAAVGRGAVVVGCGTGDGAFVGWDVLGGAPDSDVGAQLWGEDVGVVVEPGRQGLVCSVAYFGGKDVDQTSSRGEVGAPRRMPGYLGWDVGQPRERAGPDRLFSRRAEHRPGCEAHGVGVPRCSVVEPSLWRGGPFADGSRRDGGAVAGQRPLERLGGGELFGDARQLELAVDA